MPEYALRKSVGSLSAGTRVFINEQPGKTRAELYCVTLDHVHEIVVPTSDLVQLRPRSTVGPTKNRAARRAEKHESLQPLTGE